MGIDLGTANTLIYIKDEGIVLNEPTVIAVDRRDGKIIATGHEAKLMLGKAPAVIKVIRPLKDGVISDFDMTAEMLKEYILDAVNGKKAGLRVSVGVPSGVTEVEKRAVEEVVREMGAKEVHVLDEPLAAAIGAGLNVDSSISCLVVDIGGGTTDIAIISLGGIVASTSLRYGGDRFNEVITQYIRRENSLLIGEHTAERIKQKIGCALVDIDELGHPVLKTCEASGRDIISGLPKTIEVNNLQIQEAMAEALDSLVDAIKITIEKAPPEVAADIASRGIMIAGGGAYLHNLDRLIAERTEMRVNVAENALEVVAIGTGKSLEDPERLKIYEKV